MNYKDEIIKFSKGIGLDLIGFTQCRKFTELIPMFEKRKQSNLQNEFEEWEIEKRINPFIFMPEGKTIVSIAFPYLFPESKKSKSGFSKYTLGRDYHRVVMNYLHKVCAFIEELGGKAIPLVDSNPLPERYIAYLSGLGFIGKNNMLITKEYGSFVFLGEIITDMEIVNSPDDYEKKSMILQQYEMCGTCENCITNCPTKAINKAQKNSNICMSYLTQKKDIEDKWLGKFEGKLFGCDNCQDPCPYNENIQYSKLEEFRPFEFMMKENLDELLRIDNKSFKEMYGCTSCGWRGKNVLQRNALICGGEKINNIQHEDIKSPYVKDYYDRLLKLFKL